MGKQPKNNLTEVLKQSEGGLHAPETPNHDPVVETKSKRPACREGKKVVMCHVDEDVHTQLEYLKIETKSTKQDLVSEALNLLFAKYDKPPIA